MMTEDTTQFAKKKKNPAANAEKLTALVQESNTFFTTLDELPPEQQRALSFYRKQIVELKFMLLHGLCGATGNDQFLQLATEHGLKNDITNAGLIAKAAVDKDRGYQAMTAKVAIDHGIVEPPPTQTGR